MTVIIGFLLCFIENNGLKSMANMHIFTNEWIHLYCNKKINEVLILTNVRTGPGI